MNKELNNPAVRPDCFSVRSWRSIKNNHDVKVRCGCSMRRKYALRQECVTALGESFFNHPCRGNDRLCDFHPLIMSVVTERMAAISCWLMALKGNVRERLAPFVNLAHPLGKPPVPGSRRVASGLRHQQSPAPYATLLRYKCSKTGRQMRWLPDGLEVPNLNYPGTVPSGSKSDLKRSSVLSKLASRPSVLVQWSRPA